MHALLSGTYKDHLADFTLFIFFRVFHSECKQCFLNDEEKNMYLK